MQIRSILVALGREGDPSLILAKAVMLARCFKARVEIFVCDTESAFELQHEYDADDNDRVRQSGLAKLRAWTERLWQSLDVNDIPVTLDVVYETPLYEAISRKAKCARADLVVRGIGTGAKCKFGVSDYDLVWSCPVPLLLTRGRPWRSAPTVAAAVDISGEESPGTHPHEPHRSGDHGRALRDRARIGVCGSIRRWLARCWTGATRAARRPGGRGGRTSPKDAHPQRGCRECHPRICHPLRLRPTGDRGAHTSSGVDCTGWCTDEQARRDGGLRSVAGETDQL